MKGSQAFQHILISEIKKGEHHQGDPGEILQSFKNSEVSPANTRVAHTHARVQARTHARKERRKPQRREWEIQMLHFSLLFLRLVHCCSEIQRLNLIETFIFATLISPNRHAYENQIPILFNHPKILLECTVLFG